MTTPTAIRIDLISDTSTRPTPAMRRAMAEAPVGDEQRGEDPSVDRLCARVADLLGKQAAMFLPSGTMCNQIAILVHCRPGDEIIAAADSHIVGSEGAGAAALAGSYVRPVACARGIFSGDDVTAAVRAAKPKSPRSRLVEVEQTNNRGGGAIWPLEAIESVGRAAHAHGLDLHMDGARLMNAAVASGISARAYAAPVDSVWLDLSKGLGCPVGGVLAGSSAFVEAAWVWKHRLGGAMRQAGVLAAAGLHALDHRPSRRAPGRGPPQRPPLRRARGRGPRGGTRSRRGGDQPGVHQRRGYRPPRHSLKPSPRGPASAASASVSMASSACARSPISTWTKRRP